MRKLILATIALLGFAFTSQAQDTKTVKKTEKTTKTVQKGNDAKTVKKTETETKVVLKKDGTPDKRYKTSQKLKKDGTPDKRYKK